MAYCTNCGVLLDAGVRFCPNCGTAVVTIAPAAERADYQVVLVSRGTCTRAVALDILSDLLGYTDAEAAQILGNLPMATAIDLTAVQAQYIAQAMAEYGMEVAIYNGVGIVDMTTAATASVYDTSGSFLSNVAAVLAGLTIGNRISRYERWVKPAPVVFRPTYRRPAPLTVYRRRAVPASRPVVTVRPAPRPIPARPATPPPAARPIPATPVRPAPAPRPVPAAPAVRPAPVQPARPATTGAGRNTPRAVPGSRTPGGKPGPHR